MTAPAGQPQQAPASAGVAGCGGDGPPPGITGLVNLGNTGFLNAVLQMLLACPPLRDALVAGDRKQSMKRGPLGFALQQVFAHVHGEAAFGKGVAPRVVGWGGICSLPYDTSSNRALPLLLIVTTTRLWSF